MRKGTKTARRAPGGGERARLEAELVRGGGRAYARRMKASISDGDTVRGLRALVASQRRNEGWNEFKASIDRIGLKRAGAILRRVASARPRSVLQSA